MLLFLYRWDMLLFCQLMFTFKSFYDFIIINKWIKYILTQFFLFISDCGMSMSLPSLIGDITCHMVTCTAVECCNDIDFLRHSFKTYVMIDPCNNQLSVGIEELFFNRTLSGYKWGNFCLSLIIIFYFFP